MLKLLPPALRCRVYWAKPAEYSLRLTVLPQGRFIFSLETHYKFTRDGRVLMMLFVRSIINDNGYCPAMLRCLLSPSHQANVDSTSLLEAAIL